MASGKPSSTVNLANAMPLPSKAPSGLAESIFRLYDSGCADILQALRQEAADPQDATLQVSALLRLPLVAFADMADREADFEGLSYAQAAQRGCCLFKPGLNKTLLVITDPFDTDTFAWATTRFGNIEFALASAETWTAWLAHAETSMNAFDSMPARSAEGGVTSAAIGMPDGAQALDLRSIGEGASEAVRFVNSSLYDALKIGASDIHLETDYTGLAMKFRIDGVLTAMRRLEGLDLASQSISRIKVMAQLDIAERRIPQDGRLQISYQGRLVDVRVSIMPSIHGEDAVLRVLDRQHLAQSLSGLTLAKLGFDSESQRRLHALCRKPHGMFLVTGPTGSGKTTTLYAAIAETHESRDKIVTIEDPVEYQLPGILQIPVNERKGLTFARGLRSILRHDPDKILVGEIRDAETAQIAVQSALTGHLVFTTVHANTVFDVVGRFEQFGMDSFTFASAINGILAQRLLRRLCSHCARPASAEELGIVRERLAQDDTTASATSSGKWRTAVGCEHCRGSGYQGRFALGELLLLTPSIKAMISQRAPLVDLQRAAEQAGWRSLTEQAVAAAATGLTTFAEVERVAL